MEWLSSPEAWVSLLTLTMLEIVLGIDNIIFITILVGRLPERQRQLGRTLGLFFAMFTRILLLLSITWVIGLTKPLFSILDHVVSGRDIVLLLGGLFLIGKSTQEIHHSLEGEEESTVTNAKNTLILVIMQIAVLDIVFSLDSVITAVGLADHVSVMVIAIVIAVMVMMFAAKPIGDFVEEHPTLKMLALSFLILVGVTLMAEGMNFQIPKGYIYCAMAFSLSVEALNIRLRTKRKQVAKLAHHYKQE